MNDHLISRSRFLDALVLDADNKTDLIQVHQALEKAVISPDEVRGVGEWEKVRDRGGYLTPGGTPIVRCSACDGAEHLSGVEFPETFRFCPSCGARMKGAEDGTTDNT